MTIIMKQLQSKFNFYLNRQINMVDLDDFNHDMVQDSLEVFASKDRKRVVTPVKDITNFVDDLVHGSSDKELKPYLPSDSNLIDLIDPDVGGKKVGRGLGFNENGKLEYDDVLDCWYDPDKGTYHQKN